jgi:molybdopterin-guanine dinucleotide biosynthesis protein A
VLPITAFILAGGKSVRMGSDKAFLELGGCSLLSRALDLARATSSDVRIVGDSEKFAAFGPIVPDIYPGRGPLGGIHAGLSISPADYNLILAVDLPFIDLRFLQYLIAEAQSAHAVVTVPSASRHFHPLCAVYRKTFLPTAERALAEGRNKLDALFSEVPMRVISEAELQTAGFDAAIFRNLNTPEDWQRANSSN